MPLFMVKAHLLKDHGRIIKAVAGVTDPEELVWDVYKEALSIKERQKMPTVGPAIDRRAFEHTTQRYNDDSIQSLICFCCARICLNTGGARSDIEFKKGGWILALKPGVVAKNFSKAEFEHRYQRDGPLAAHHPKSSAKRAGPDFSDWHLNWHPDVIKQAERMLPDGKPFNPDVVAMKSKGILCCPEDQRCEHGCHSKKLLCKDCEIPICRKCMFAMS